MTAKYFTWENSEMYVPVNEIPKKYSDSEAWRHSGSRVERITYPSHDYLGDGGEITKPAFIYLPENIDSGEQYDVLYLLHGVGGDEYEWGMTGKDSVVARTMDALIKEDGMKPFIIVAPNGRSAKDHKTRSFENMHGFYRFGSELRADLIPYIEANYPVKRTRDGRAVAGLSMGGMQTINIGLCECLDLFSRFGAFSACPTTYDSDKIAECLKKFPDEEIKFFYNICGVADGVAYRHAFAAFDGLEGKTDKLSCEKNLLWQEIEGGMHDFGVWYPAFYNFARIISNIE